VAEQVRERFARDGHREFARVSPIGLDALGRRVALGEEHLFRRSMPAQPVGHAALERAQRLAVHLTGMRDEKMLEECLRFDLGARF